MTSRSPRAARSTRRSPTASWSSSTWPRTSTLGWARRSRSRRPTAGARSRSWAWPPRPSTCGRPRAVRRSSSCRTTSASSSRPRGSSPRWPRTAQRSEVLFRLADGASSKAVESARQAVLQAGALDAFTLDEQPSNAALQEDVSGFAEMSVMFPAFFLIAAAFATYVMLGRMISGQMANIGTMRALGFTQTHHHTRTTLPSAWSLGIVASVVGVVIGASLAEAITRLYTSTLSIPAAVVDVRASDDRRRLPDRCAHRVRRGLVPCARGWPHRTRHGHARSGAAGRRGRVHLRAAHPAAARPARALAARSSAASVGRVAAASPPSSA